MRKSRKNFSHFAGGNQSLKMQKFIIRNALGFQLPFEMASSNAAHFSSLFWSLMDHARQHISAATDVLFPCLQPLAFPVLIIFPRAAAPTQPPLAHFSWAIPRMHIP